MRSAEVLGDISGMLPPILASMLDFYLDAYERFLGVRECALHDPLAALVASGAVEVVSEHRPLTMTVVTEGPDRGRTVAALPEDGRSVRAKPDHPRDRRARRGCHAACATHPHLAPRGAGRPALTSAGVLAFESS